MLSEGPEPREREKEGKGGRISGEMEENKMEVKRKVGGGSQKGRERRRGGKRRKQERLGREKK